MSLDLYLFNLINGFAGKWAWLDYSAIFFAKYCEYILWLCLILFLVFGFKKKLEMVVLAIISGAVSRFIIGFIIRFLWFRPRPFLAQNFIPLINQSPAEASFPSGHALFYFALATIVYFYNKNLGILFFISSFLIALSRVFVGVHWPSDILAGAIIGILTGLLFYKLFKKHEDYIFRRWRSV
ncbi:MAG: phosphatase PAP2 family protein [Patescibacteria group bacterium]